MEPENLEVTDYMVNIDELLGSVKLVATSQHFPDGGYRLGSYAIYYDRFGQEVRRTENQWNVLVTVEPNDRLRLWKRIKTIGNVIFRWP